jgi:hypothetical protein
VDDVAAHREADLPLVEERAPRSGRRRGLDVGVVEHHERAVAAHLQHQPLEHPAGCLSHLVAGRGRARERDHPHVRIGDERLADLAVARDHVQHALRDARLLEQPRDHDPAGDRRVVIRLEHDGVAERERRPDRAHRQHVGEVPRGDHADDTDRHPPGDARAPRRHRGQDLAERMRDERRGHVELTDRRHDLVLDLPADRPRLADQPRSELRMMALHQLRGAAYDGDALGERRRRPLPLRLLGRLRGPRDRLRIPDAGRSKHLARGGLDALDPACAVDPAAAVDLSGPLLLVEQVPRFDGRFGREGHCRSFRSW